MSTSNMATMILSSRQVVFTSGNKIGVFQLGSNDFSEILIPSSVQEKEQNKEENCGTNRILAAAFSKNGQYFAVADDYKYLLLYNCSDKWTLLSKRLVSRRCTRIVFTEDDRCVLVADKSGDVYQFSVQDVDDPGTLLLGHLSMLLDMILINNDKLMVTCDRDEKIRVSQFPNAYNIKGYCLGHTEFVSRLLYIKEKNVIISGSGDGSVRFWTVDGKELTRLQWSQDSPPGGGEDNQEKITPAIKCLTYSSENNLLLFSSDCSPCIKIYSVSWSGNEENLSVLTNHKQDLYFKDVPWDMSLDESSNLWVLQPVQEESVSIWKYDDDKLVEVCPESGDILTNINSRWEFFKDSLSVESISCTLKKAKVDNMTDYLERKQQRLSGKGNTTNLGPPSAKKIKVK